MLSSIATRDTIQEHISEYLDMMENGEEIIMTKNGKEIGRFLPRGKVVTLIGERLKGILSNRNLFGIDLYEAGIGKKIEE